ncbi:MAG: threonine synthase [Armatimonadota bacterium]|jgi:threonine synthase
MSGAVGAPPKVRQWPGVIEAYREFLPVSDATPVVTLLEGDTPLVECPRLAAAIAPNLRLLVKFEGANPTGSFKDRGMTMAVSMAVEQGAEMTICASTGNTAAAAAAYSARAGIGSAVVVPAGHIALGKLAQALVHDARVVAVEGSFDDALRLVREITEQHPVELVNSINPFRIQGQKTAAFEVCDRLGGPPDYHALPVGNAGNIRSYWKGYREYHERGVIEMPPKMLGFQAAGAAPIVRGEPVAQPETIATAIRIGNPASWKQAEAARDESGGLIETVTDEQIVEAYKLLAATEGLFAEPASAASIAGVKQLAERGYFGDETATVTCTLTGHGLKDPERAIAEAPEHATVPAELDAVVGALGL